MNVDKAKKASILLKQKEDLERWLVLIQDDHYFIGLLEYDAMEPFDSKIKWKKLPFPTNDLFDRYKMLFIEDMRNLLRDTINELESL